MVDLALLPGDFSGFASGFVGNLLQGIAAFAVVIVALGIGYIVAWLVNLGIKRFLRHVNLEAELKKHHLHDSLLGFSVTQVTTTLVWLWIMTFFFGYGAGIMGFPFLVQLSSMALGYMPYFTMGIVILAAGMLIGDYITDRMKMSKGVPFVNIIAMIVEVFIIYNALVIALPMLLPRASTILLEQSFSIVLAALGLMFGLGGAIAIGLGLKDVVSDIARKNRDKFNLL